MLGHFYYQEKGNQILITNDTGSYCFLDPNEFIEFVHEKLPEKENKQAELREKGFWFDQSEETYLRQMIHPIRDGNSYLFDSTCLFIFSVTNECNNRCIYCQANGNSCRPQRMEEKVADAALEKIAACPSGKITIEFQGGEPLINFHIIAYIVQRAETVLADKEISFAVVSNLGLLTEEMAAFFKEHNLSVSTSLDGPAFLHDVNRPTGDGKGSYDTVIRGMQILRKHQICPGAIETTTRQSLPYAEEIVDIYAANGFDQVFLRPLTRLGAAAEQWDRIGYTPEEFLEFYRKGFARILDYNQRGIRIVEYHASLFLKKIIRGKSENYMELRSPCGAALGQMAITSNGNVYSCDEGRMMAEMGDEAFRLGNVFEGDYNDWIESPCSKAIGSASLLEIMPGCCDCVYKPYCGLCPVVNYAINGSITRKATDRCRIYKGILDLLFEYIQQGDEIIMKIFSEWSV